MNDIFWISHLKMNKADSKVEKVSVEFFNGGLGEDLDEYPRSNIIDSIREGDKWFTCKEINHCWNKINEIKLIKVGDDSFLRTDDKQIESDDLDDLPEISNNKLWDNYRMIIVK